MKLIKRVVLVIIAIPIIAWAFFRFVYYPIEIERHTYADYTLVTYAEPTHSFGHPVQLIFEALLVFGSIENNTQVRADGTVFSQMHSPAKRSSIEAVLSSCKGNSRARRMR